jgi:sulfoxide reductase heme-binding subunit YedZ
MTGPDPAQYGWWLASRASGVVALALVTCSAAIGLTMAGKVSRRPGVGRKLKALHEHTALAGLVAIAIHGITLLGDRWLRPGISGILMPFSMGYRPVFTGLGILAGYLAAALGLSFYARRRIGPRLWRTAHRATIVVYLLALVHVIGAGTDAGSLWLRGFMVVTGIPVALLFVRRMLPRRRRRPAVAQEARS